MDYDEKEFQIEDPQLAEERGAKFPSSVLPFTIPKFEFDESIQGHLKFDSSIETEGFLSIESQEGSNWIEDFSRGSSAIVSNSGGLPSCGFLRHKNVWLEVTSLESVEMLLKSVGQEDMIRGQNVIEGSVPIDEREYVEQKPEPNQRDCALSRVSGSMGLVAELPSDPFPENLDWSKENEGRKLTVADPAGQSYGGKPSDCGTSTTTYAYVTNNKCALALDEKCSTTVNSHGENCGGAYSIGHACPESEDISYNIETTDDLGHQTSLGHAIINENTDCAAKGKFDGPSKIHENSDRTLIDDGILMVNAVPGGANDKDSESSMSMSVSSPKTDEVDDRTKCSVWVPIDDEKLAVNGVFGGANDEVPCVSKGNFDAMKQRFESSDRAPMNDENLIVNTISQGANDKTLCPMSVAISELKADEMVDGNLIVSTVYECPNDKMTVCPISIAISEPKADEVVDGTKHSAWAPMDDEKLTVNIVSAGANDKVDCVTKGDIDGTKQSLNDSGQVPIDDVNLMVHTVERGANDETSVCSMSIAISELKAAEVYDEIKNRDWVPMDDETLTTGTVSGGVSDRVESVDSVISEKIDGTKQNFDDSDQVPMDDVNLLADTVERGANGKMSVCPMSIEVSKLKDVEVDDRVKNSDWVPMDAEKLTAGIVSGGENAKVDCVIKGKIDVTKQSFDDSDQVPMDDVNLMADTVERGANDACESSISVSDSDLKVVEVANRTENSDWAPMDVEEVTDIVSSGVNYRSSEFSMPISVSELESSEVDDRTTNTDGPSDTMDEKNAGSSLTRLASEINADKADNRSANLGEHPCTSTTEGNMDDVAYQAEKCISMVSSSEKYEKVRQHGRNMSNDIAGTNSVAHDDYVSVSNDGDTEKMCCDDHETLVECNSRTSLFNYHAHCNEKCNGENGQGESVTYSSVSLLGEECETPLVRNEVGSNDLNVAQEVASSILSVCLSMYKQNVVPMEMDTCRSNSATNNVEKGEIKLDPVVKNIGDDTVETGYGVETCHTDTINEARTMQCSCEGSLNEVLFEGQTDIPMRQLDNAPETHDSLNVSSCHAVVCHEIVNCMVKDKALAVESTVSSLKKSSAEKCMLDVVRQSEDDMNNFSMGSPPEALKFSLSPGEIASEKYGIKADDKYEDNAKLAVGLHSHSPSQVGANDAIEGDALPEDTGEAKSSLCQEAEFVEDSGKPVPKASSNKGEIVVQSPPSCWQAESPGNIQNDKEAIIRTMANMTPDTDEETPDVKASSPEVEIVAQVSPSCSQESCADTKNDEETNMVAREAQVTPNTNDEGNSAKASQGGVTVDHETSSGGSSFNSIEHSKDDSDLAKGTEELVGPNTSVCEIKSDEPQSFCSGDFNVKHIGAFGGNTSSVFEPSLSDTVERETVRCSPAFSTLHDAQSEFFKASTEVSRGNCQTPDGQLLHGSSRGTPRRKAKRASGKMALNETEKNIGLPEYVSSAGRYEKGGMAPIISSPVLYEGKSISRQNSFQRTSVQASEVSDLPDLNAAASPLAYQQPFTDLQQVQLRAQIFVYGSLIQGTVPDEAYMISAFGTSGGGRHVWESVWHTSLERMHEQNSHPITPEPAYPPRSGARPESSFKLGNQNKVLSSAINRGSITDTPFAAKASAIPLSSPLWSISTPSNGSSMSNNMLKGPVMDYYQTFSALHRCQNSPIVGHPAWFTQGPLPLSWASSQQVSPHVPTFSSVEMAQPTTIVHSSSVKSIHETTVADASLHLESSAVKTSFQYSTDQKVRMRNAITSEALDPASSSHQTRQKTVPDSGLLAEATPKNAGYAKPPISAPHAEQSFGLIASKVKEAMLQAEEAATHAAAALSQTQQLWAELGNKKDSELVPDLETRLSAAAVAVATAASVAKAAAAAARVSSIAALQAKTMAEEAFASSTPANSQNNADDFSSLGMATPASILKRSEAMSAGSIILAAREATRKKIEAASAASKRAENLDSIVKAAELAAEAVSLASKIAAMSDPPLNELIEAGLDGFWKLPQFSARSALKDNTNSCEPCRHFSEQGNDAFSTDSRKTMEPAEMRVTNATEPVMENHTTAREVSTSSGKESEALIRKNNGESVRETEVISRSDPVYAEARFDSSTSNCIKEGSFVEVLKDDRSCKTWVLGTVTSLKDGKAFVCYTEQPFEGGHDRPNEWVKTGGSENECPRIRAARFGSSRPCDGTRKRQRTGMRGNIWSVGDRVDAWIQHVWCEGTVVETNNDDKTTMKVKSLGKETTFAVRVWHVRPSLVWKDGQWTECVGSNEKPSPENDTPHGKRPKLDDPTRLPLIPVSSDKQEDSNLSLSAGDKTFNVGKCSSDEEPRPLLAGFQKDGAGGSQGIPRPGKKRKFMDVSKKFGGERSYKVNEASDSTKLARFLAAQRPRGRNDLRKMRPGMGPKFVNPGKTLNAGRPVSRTSTENVDTFQSSRFEDMNAKRFPGSSSKTEQSGKGGPSGTKLGRIEETKVFNGNTVKSASHVEPRRSNRRIQPTSKLLEGLQSSFSVAKTPSTSHDRGHKNQKSYSRGRRE